MAGARMHHAWILSGRRGVGKAAFALQAARELVGGPAMDNHPDIIVLRRPPKDEKEAAKRDEGKPYETKRNIPIEEVRAMQRRLTTRPTLGERRVVIVDPADDLETNASNALLKSLEEPPQGTFFLLVSHRIGRLLPTIRSRCRVLRFPAVPDEEIDAVLKRFWVYTPEVDNCQLFVKKIVDRNHLAKTPAIQDAIRPQDGKALINTLGVAKDLPAAVTNLAARGARALNGDGLKKKRKKPKPGCACGGKIYMSL